MITLTNLPNNNTFSTNILFHALLLWKCNGFFQNKFLDFFQSIFQFFRKQECLNREITGGHWWVALPTGTNTRVAGLFCCFASSAYRQSFAPAAASATRASLVGLLSELAFSNANICSQSKQLFPSSDSGHICSSFVCL
jgi:hypothetical protein